MPPRGKASSERYKELTGKNEVQFINLGLSDDERKKLKDWVHKEAEHVFDHIERVVESGISYSVKYDTRNQCYSAFLTRQADKRGGTTRILSGRGSTAFAATMGALYRHLVVLEGDWDAYSQPSFVLDDE